MATKKRPGTGDRRKTNQPVKIDRLSPKVHEAIVQLRNQYGKTWQEIEDLSAEPIGNKTGGFVDWMNLPTAVLELFPNMRLPHTNLQRWYDLRVAQVQKDVMHTSAKAREITQAFAKAGIVADDEAVINASRDTLMGILSEDGSVGGRANVAKSLIKLGDLMQKAKTNRIRERKVTVDEGTLQMKLDEIKRRAEKLIKAVEKGDPAAGMQLTREELLGQIRGLYGVA